MFAYLSGRNGRAPNVGTGERIACGLAGAAFLANGVRRPSMAHAGLAVLGGVLVQRGIIGRCPLYRLFGIDTVGRRAAPPSDVIADASADSFPASDPPAWTPVSALGDPRDRRVSEGG